MGKVFIHDRGHNLYPINTKFSILVSLVKNNGIHGSHRSGNTFPQNFRDLNKSHNFYLIVIKLSVHINTVRLHI